MIKPGDRVIIGNRYVMGGGSEPDKWTGRRGVVVAVRPPRTHVEYRNADIQLDDREFEDDVDNMALSRLRLEVPR